MFAWLSHGSITKARNCLGKLLAISLSIAAISSAAYIYRPRDTLLKARLVASNAAMERSKVKTRVTLENIGPPLTLEEIHAFEQEIGGRLPDDYTAFLLDHNGGLTKPLLGLVWQGDLEKVGAFSQLLPKTDCGVRLSLSRLRELNRVSTDGFLPIASTLNEQYVCLGFRGGVGGVFHTVYTYKTAYRGDLVPVDVRMVLVADSFTEFLDNLTEIPDPNCTVEELGRRGTRDDLSRFLAEGNSIDAVSKNHLSLICEAIKFDNRAMVQACIEHRANLSGSVTIAVGNVCTDLIETLIRAGANVNERDEFGNTPLSYVGGTALPGEESARNRELRKLLIKLGAVK